MFSVRRDAVRRGAPPNKSMRKLTIYRLSVLTFALNSIAPIPQERDEKMSKTSPPK